MMKFRTLAQQLEAQKASGLHVLSLYKMPRAFDYVGKDGEVVHVEFPDPPPLPPLNVTPSPDRRLQR